MSPSTIGKDREGHISQLFGRLRLEDLKRRTMICCVLQQFSSTADLYLVRVLAEFATNMEEHHRQLFVGQPSHVIDGLIDPDLLPMVEMIWLIFVSWLQRRPQEPKPGQSTFFAFLAALA